MKGQTTGGGISVIQSIRIARSLKTPKNNSIQLDCFSTIYFFVKINITYYSQRYDELEALWLDKCKLCGLATPRILPGWSTNCGNRWSLTLPRSLDLQWFVKISWWYKWYIPLSERRDPLARHVVVATSSSDMAECAFNVWKKNMQHKFRQHLWISLSSSDCWNGFVPNIWDTLCSFMFFHNFSWCFSVEQQPQACVCSCEPRRGQIEQEMKRLEEIEKQRRDSQRQLGSPHSRGFNGNSSEHREYPAW